MSTPDHLDLDALADALAGEPTPAHVDGCAACSAALAELRVASAQVTSDLARLPPVQLPPEVASRLAESLRTAPTGSTVTTLPAAWPTRSSPRRWLPAAAAVVLLLGGAAYGVSRMGSGSDNASSTAGSAGKAAPAPGVDVVRSSSGTDYTGRASLAAAVPHLLTGSAPAAAMAPMSGAQSQTQSQTQTQSRAAGDPLARLRDNAGLAECLLALLPPEDPSVRPLAIDYASYKGAPAMVVVLPSTLPSKLDVFVVGPACSRANDSTLFYTSVDKP